MQILSLFTVCALSWATLSVVWFSCAQRSDNRVRDGPGFCIRHHECDFFLLSHDPYPDPRHDDSEAADFLSLATLAVVMGLGSVSAITSASVFFLRDDRGRDGLGFCIRHHKRECFFCFCFPTIPILSPERISITFMTILRLRTFSA